MISVIQRDTQRYTLQDAVHATVAEYLYETFNKDDDRIGNLDRWSHQRIGDENLAKAMLIFESDDPAEACYRDLVREIEMEAETGVFLASENADRDYLREVVSESGVSGRLHRDMALIASEYLPHGRPFSIDEQYRVWDELRKRHDRAHLDARVSEIIMGFMMDDAEIVKDMTSVMRALAYTWHEDRIRSGSGMPVLLDDLERRDLKTMVGEWQERCGDYEARAGAIRREADSRARIPLS